ncbi:hypothetical protein SteCoe_25222 [Stentor coeruleus]|uniref:PRELI/MSF1 domain-containing protein n=1 Tax=Stentor coeruleus TaxID=5963 RepID=A0A1R2BFV8_9CILI|nr:hypothetical protein SteCoe_25222 [Stentor coeruleus]
MTERTFEISYNFERPWDLVCRAYLAKYPHPLLSHVETLDTLERYVDDNGCLVTCRVMTSSFLKFSSVAGFEQSVIDPINKTIYLNSNNLSHRNLNSSNEICRYSVVDDKTTLYTLSYKINVAPGLGLLIGPLINTIKGNFNKGIQVLEEIMRNRFGGPLLQTS